MFGLSIQVFCWPEKGPSTIPSLVLLTAKAGHMVVWYGWNNRLSWFRLWWSSVELTNGYPKTAPIMQFASFIICFVFFFIFFSLFFFDLIPPFLTSLKAVRCWHPHLLFCWLVPLEWALFLSVGWDLWTAAGSCPTFAHLCYLPLRSLCQRCAILRCPTALSHATNTKNDINCKRYIWHSMSVISGVHQWRQLLWNKHLALLFSTRSCPLKFRVINWLTVQSQ